MNLRTRFALALGSVVVVTILAIGLGVVNAAQDLPQETVDRYLREQAKENRNERLQVRDLLRVAEGTQVDDGRRIADATLFQVLFADGVIGAARGTSQVLPISAEEWELSRDGGRDILRSIKWNGANFRMITFAVEAIDQNGNGRIEPDERGGALQVARDVDDAGELVRSIVPSVALFGLIGALIAGLAGWVMARRFTRPISELTGTTERVAETQDLAERIPVDRSDEVGRLATSFNTMLAALETSRRQQQQLVMDANHELRTPLTSMRTNIEVLQRNHQAMDDGDRERLLADVTSELDELTSLVSELVDSATSIDQSDEPFEVVELAEVVEAAVTVARRRTGRDIGLAIRDPAIVRVRPTLITRAVQNLLSNAHKFSPADTPLGVVVDGARVAVNDAGPGIAEDDLPHVFDRFYRATSSRSKPGSGLGLAMVRQIVEAHDGTVQAGTSPVGGASVGFELSAAVAAEDALG